jgi:hypothetical protein
MGAHEVAATMRKTDHRELTSVTMVTGARRVGGRPLRVGIGIWRAAAGAAAASQLVTTTTVVASVVVRRLDACIVSFVEW